MQLDFVIQQISETSKDLIDSLQEAGRHSLRQEPFGYSLGLQRSARLPILAALYNELQRPFLLLTDRADHALTLLDELSLWLPSASLLLFPEPTPLFYENAPWGETTRRDRLKVLTTLAAYNIPGGQTYLDPSTTNPIIIAPARALMTRTLPRRDFLKATRKLRQGQIIQLDELTRSWISLGYEHVNTVIAPGRFARRGGILDIWPPANSQPTRIEFFGDEIETMRPFDPSTQRTIRQDKAIQHRLLITPAREYLLGKGHESLSPDDLSEYHIPILHTFPASVIDYLPKDTLVLIDNLQVLEDSIIEVEEQAVNLRQDLISDGTLQEDYPLPYLSWGEITDTLSKHRPIELGPSASLEESTLSDIAQWFTPEPRFGGRLKPFMEHLFELIESGQQVTVVSRQATRLQELWRERESLLSAPSSLPVFIQGNLEEGWLYSAQKSIPLHLFTDGEIFGWRRAEIRRRQRPVAEAPESAYADLQAGDFVVHIDHGVGCFISLVERTIDGIEREYLCIEYANEAQLFVPVHQADRITRYVGPDNRTPKLSRLGGTEWRNVKSHVKEAVQEVAEDLLELYAKRTIVEGHAFSKDTSWQQELEASFPYIETEDQKRVLEEVKADMEQSRPMDRLICGDVGYGKTEVALRAAFKAVMDGKQVAILVPTTVLAQQHFQTFNQRLAAFPIVVEMLSRFRTPQQQRDILPRLENGSIDIVIGTHRLISSDIQFKDLGLLIIDEEQRFGVSHKEALKKMRTEVDVLTLTATPIPRTLYMTLTGVRDISTIDTPPEERLPIITHVGPYSPKLIRQAILRELERGGQVFFVHNRVQTIGAMHSHLVNLVPEARMSIAHGQMPESELSARMKQFTSGEVDVLISTSIIESGLDIPNANTLIVDRADTFGLTQLYQLRGRVGRGAQRAYAYFFRHKRKPPTPEGHQRMDTIAENIQLGAGFSIAMRDLEIRGAGDLLGTRQHGQIAAVGFHLYTRLLADSVRRLHPQADAQLLPTALQSKLYLPINVDLPWRASIPSDYVADKGMRLHLYRRLADIQTESEITSLDEEFNDRFGPPPEPVRNLLLQLKIKILAERAGLTSLYSENGQFSLRFPDSEIPPDLPNLGPHVRVGKTALWVPYKSISNWPDLLIEILNDLQANKVSQSISH
ncbi:MAG: transcription-repair coupling factor [Anaerolineales bacterium]|nr:transcription-repair coupling factor [Anaerolineales bacterium]